MTVLADRRKRPRVELCLPVRIESRSDGGVRDLKGSTLNISTDGLYCVVTDPLTAGEWVECVVTLPCSGSHRQSDLYLRCSAQVVRVEQVEDGRYGVACSISDYTVVRSLPRQGHQTAMSPTTT